ncbi:hypothetical protein ACHAXA_003240 [Cyclostephanos tholiformis]|uniref:RRM domain-containing protein n=1 Tax=Cyclostephanos tholiformis TaxID=382380 RepID=A0ABD3SB52_9STRA
MTTPAAAATAVAPSPASTTRICIKNLHPSFDETQLKSHLRTVQPNLLITDCKILKTKDGRSRKIAFVGFQTPSQAETAVSHFDRSFAGTSRLSVSLAFSTKKKPQPSEYRPWSKHSVGSSRNEKLQQQKQEQQEKGQRHHKDKNYYKAKLDEGAGDDDDRNGGELDETTRKREEYLSAMGIATSSEKGKISKSKFWANDDAIPEQGIHQTNIATSVDVTEEGNKSSESGNDRDSSSCSDSASDNGAADNMVTKKARKEKISSDLDFLRSKQLRVNTLPDDSDNEGNDDDDAGDSSSAPDDDSSYSISNSKDENDKADKSIGGEKVESSINLGEKVDPVNPHQLKGALVNRLFIRNLPFTTTEEDLFEKFSDFGRVTSVHIPVDDSKRNKGYAFINFEHKDDAKLAMDTMDGEDFQGRLIHILPSRPAADQMNDIDGSDMTYKERQDLTRQKDAEKSSKGWSASFLRGDAVVDNLSDRLGISKGDILNVKDGISSGNAAVRLALGETHIISENVAFFEDHGVNVLTLEATPGKKSGSGAAPLRSKTMILVKNLPYGTSLEDLTKVFHDIGGDVPQKILLPPSKTAALVEYGHATDARRAFRKLAYKKFKHVPLYLEWAPIKVEGKEIPTTEDTTKQIPLTEEVTENVLNQGSSDIVVKPGLLEEDPFTEAADTGVSQTLYVKNLNFATTEEQLEQAFVRAGIQPRAVKIPTKAAPSKRNGASPAVDSSRSNDNLMRLSLGFGFVEFSSETEALKAMKALQGKAVDGHSLDIKLSTKSISSTEIPAADKPPNRTKIMIRNVPFEATRKDLLLLFGSFGQLKKVRLPKKFDGTHRGFAFCEFVTSKEAQNAMTSLSRTHLYGRHLVLEWAEAADEDGSGKIDVDAIREKTKRDAMRAGLGGTRKKGKHLKF